MGIIEINKEIIKIIKLIKINKLFEAFNLIDLLIEKYNLSLLKEQKNKLFDIYKNILKYSFTGIKDPERDKIFNNLKKSTIQLTDSLKSNLILKNKNFVTSNLKNEVDFEFKTNKAIIENAIINNEKDKNFAYFFNKIWLSEKILESDFLFIDSLISEKKIDWVSQSVIVSAISISLFNCFDDKKFELLFKFYKTKQEKVWHRALVGIVIGVYLFSDRLDFYPELNNKIKKIIKDDDFKKNITLIIAQILSTKETEKITRKLHNEIMPEVAKFKPKIEDKLKLDDIIHDSLSEDKNPDWETVFGDSPELLKKLEEFSKLQTEGGDVFMSAFAMLKHFDFFKETYNWFLPFYKENNTIEDAMKFEKEGFNSTLFTEGLEKSAFLCNSDKYSFVLNIKFMPEAQKSMILDMFSAELESMNELVKDDELLNKSMKNKYIFTQYIQDLYRFFKLYSYKNEFIDIFNDDFDFYSKDVISSSWFSIDLFKQIGEFYFDKEYFVDALNVYKIVFEKGIKDQDIIEKIAFSYQKLKDYENALEFYKKSELFETHLEWTTKKIALCYRELGNNQMAIEYYLKAEKNEPDNLYVQAHLGHTYLRLKDYEKALKHYFKVEYFAPSNMLILRPIAWCSFMQGKFDNSLKYYKKLIDKNEINHFDYMDMGHVEWITNNVEAAVEYYRKSLRGFNNNFELFIKEFSEDKENLIKFGIDAFEIDLLIDFLAIDY